MKKRLASSCLGMMLLFSSTVSPAATYEDYGSMPFVQMMLTMMDMMGMLDRVPNHNPYGAWPAYSQLYSATTPFTGPSLSPYGSYANPWQASGYPTYALPQTDHWGMGVNPLGNPWEPLPSATRRNLGLDGIWQGSGGDLIAIYGQRFLWTDRYQRSLSGQFHVEGDILAMRIAGHRGVTLFRIQQTADGGFTAVGRDGRLMRFKRLY